MKKIRIYISIVALIFMAVGCTENFTDINTNPYEISDSSLTQHFNNIGGYFKQLQMNIYLYDGLQTQQNLTGDAFAQYLVPPTPFAGNINNVTYYYTWYGDQWNNSYSNTMSVILDYKRNGIDGSYPNFYAWANLLKIFTMQRTTDYYGPIIYSNYGSTESEVDYDDQKTIYYSFFSELDGIVDTLSNYVNSTAFANFDLAYSGSVKKWIQVANSLRLRLAIRISKVDPAKAKTEGEKAVIQKYGVIENYSDNFNVTSSKGHALGMISIDWGDSRMSATMESVLKGYDDPRMPVFFQPATTTSAPEGDYKGIRQGIDIKEKSTYIDYSPVGTMFAAKPNKLQIITAAEVYFLRSEGVLRGWNMGGKTAQEYYEAGIKSSFDQYGLSGSSTYISNASSTFGDYVDTHNAGNSFTATSNVTIAWNESITNEQKLEKIITQKWIAEFPDGIEAWAEFRRTGYPKLKPVMVNYSGGSINTEDFVRRVIYPNSEYLTNPIAVAKASATLVGTNGISGDKGGSRVWWDNAGTNF